MRCFPVAVFIASLFIVQKTGFADEQSEILSSPISSAFQMFLALGCVIALAYLVLHKGLGFILKRQRSGEMVKVRERVPLDGKNSLYVVEIDNQLLLLASGEGGVQVVLPSLSTNRSSFESEVRLPFSTIQSNAVTGA